MLRPLATLTGRCHAWRVIAIAWLAACPSPVLPVPPSPAPLPSVRSPPQAVAFGSKAIASLCDQMEEWAKKVGCRTQCRMPCATGWHAGVATGRTPVEWFSEGTVACAPPN